MNPRVFASVWMLGTILGLPPQGWAASPTEAVKNLIESVRSYGKEASTQDSARNSKVQKVVEETLAIQDLAESVLGPHWKKLSASEQENFTQLLLALFQKVAYPKSAEFFSDLNIEYVNERVNGSAAVVETEVSHPKEGLVAIAYQLRQRNGKWVIDDVLLDGVSLVTNVRTQMQQVIAKESYQGLVKRMRDKLAEES